MRRLRTRRAGNDGARNRRGRQGVPWLRRNVDVKQNSLRKASVKELSRHERRLAGAWEGADLSRRKKLRDPLSPKPAAAGFAPTTLDVPDEVMRAVKIRAVNENRKLKDILTELLRRGLAQQNADGNTVRRRVQFPLIECTHAPQPEDEPTPERAAEILLEEEAGWHRAAGTEPVR